MADKQRKGLKILVIGEVCSGKSTVAHLISEMLEEYGITPELVDDTDGRPATLAHWKIHSPSSSRIYDALRDRKITIEQLQVSREPIKDRS
jgi:ABC-type antimicrobial peptide transport system ATPase subunit